MHIGSVRPGPAFGNATLGPNNAVILSLPWERVSTPQIAPYSPISKRPHCHRHPSTLTPGPELSFFLPCHSFSFHTSHSHRIRVIHPRPYELFRERAAANVNECPVHARAPPKLSATSTTVSIHIVQSSPKSAEILPRALPRTKNTSVSAIPADGIGSFLSLQASHGAQAEPGV